MLCAYRVFWSPLAKHKARSMRTEQMTSAAEGRRSCSQKSGLFVAHGQAQSTKHEHKAANFDQKM
jgi:hypothetical protein